MNENVNVCITPKGDKPVLHFSQFDNERVFTVTVLADDGESAVDLTELDIEFRLRKTDSHVVTIAPISVVSNVITFMTTEQLCACCGQNIASVVIMNNDSVISTLDILVDIQRDILSGGLTSESDIRNLTTQIEQIVPEVIGDDYYTKTEVDVLIDDIPTFDPTNYYDKSDVDGLLADKADADDVYTKTETDNLLADKADKSDTYTKSAVDNLLMERMGNIVFTAFTPGNYPFISFNSLYNAPIISIEGEITTSASTINLVRCGKNFLNVDAVSETKNGVTFTVVKDVNGLVSRIDVTGTATAGVSFRIGSAILLPNTYVLSGYTGGSAVGTKYINYSGIANAYGSNATNTLTSVKATTVSLQIANGAETEFTIYPMIRLSSASSDYAPFNGQVKTITIGQTVSSGTIDFARGTINDSGNIITFTPVTVDAVIGENNVYIDIGDMNTLTYVSDSDYGLMALLEAYTMR